MWKRLDRSRFGSCAACIDPNLSFYILRTETWLLVGHYELCVCFADLCRLSTFGNLYDNLLGKDSGQINGISWGVWEQLYLQWGERDGYDGRTRPAGRLLLRILWMENWPSCKLGTTLFATFPFCHRKAFNNNKLPYM